MAELYVVGQAPSRTGNGRAFTGNSGRTLLSLFGWPTYDYMAARVNLLNLLPVQQPRIEHGHGDHFDYDAAKREALRLRGHWFIFYPETHVICVGAKVFKCFTGLWRPPLKGVALHHRRYDTVVKCWNLPHPSGVNVWYSDPKNVEAARRFLRQRVRDAGNAPI